MLYWLIVAVPPTVLLLIRPRAAAVIAPTIAATWLASAIALDNFVSDDIGAIILFVFVLLPAFAAIVGMVIAVLIAPKPRLWFDAAALAILGWWLGLIVLFLGPTSVLDACDAPSLWETAVLIAAPAVWAGAGAGFGATNRPVA